MNRWHILNIGCTEVVLHPTLILFLLYTHFTGHLPLALLALVSILLHEAAHSITAALCGQQPLCIEITPLGAVMHLENINKLSLFKQLITILSGPGFTLLLCAFSIWSTELKLISTAYGRTLFQCNLVMLALNLLPFLPLDGGRLLHLILVACFPRPLASKLITSISYIGGILLILVNLLLTWLYGGWNLSLAFAGGCVMYNASTFAITQMMAELRYFVDRKIKLENKKCVRSISYVVLETFPLRKLIRRLPANRCATFICVELGTQKKLGRMYEGEMIQESLSSPGATLGEALRSAFRR